MPRPPDITFRDELDALDLSTRVRNILRQAQIHTVAELDGRYEHDTLVLIGLRVIGDRSLAEIEQALDRFHGRPSGYRTWRARAAIERIGDLLRTPR